MPACRNCGAHVTDEYVRVMSRDGEGVDVCPNCEHRIRDGTEPDGWRETVQPRSSKSRETTAYDPAWGAGDD